MGFLQRLLGRSPARSKARYRTRRLRFEGLERRTLLATVAGDFNADGTDDLAIGVPAEDNTVIAEGGAWYEGHGHMGDGHWEETGVVHVVYGGSSGLDTERWKTGEDRSGQVFSPFTSGIEVADWTEFTHFGHALAAGDFDGNGVDDLAISAPEDLVGGVMSGSVTILYGVRGAELRPDALAGYVDYWHLDDLRGARDPGELPFPSGEQDRFGQSLAAGDFNGDGVDDLAVGILRYGRLDAGAVAVIYGQYGRGLTQHLRPTLLEQRRFGDSEERGDYFGLSLAGGNFNGDRAGSGRHPVDDLAVGAPYKNVSENKDVGKVYVFYGSEVGLDPARHDTWEGTSPGGHYGYCLAAGNFNMDYDAFGRWRQYDDLAVGIPLDDVGARDVGSVEVIYGDELGLAHGPRTTYAYDPSAGDWVPDVASRWQWLLQEDLGPYRSERNDHFGWSLAAGNLLGRASATGDYEYNQALAIGTPGKDDDRGVVYVVAGAPDGLNSGPATILVGGSTELIDICSEPERRPGYRFGQSVAAGDFDYDEVRARRLGLKEHDDLVVGIPGAKDNSGALAVFYQVDRLGRAVSWEGYELWTQEFLRDEDGRGPEKGDRLGDTATMLWGYYLASP